VLLSFGERGGKVEIVRLWVCRVVEWRMDCEKSCTWGIVNNV
jgi:hypothetical protein